MTIMKKILFALAVIFLYAAPVAAQNYLTNTTLSASINSSQTTFTVASATDVEAGGALFIDHEYMDVVSVSGTRVTVSRTQKPAAHASGAVVYITTRAEKPLAMLTHNGARRMGICSTSSSVIASTALATVTGGILPIIDIDTGDLYGCRRGANSAWLWVITNAQTYNGEAGSVPTTWP